jgi:hypothetical protein
MQIDMHLYGVYALARAAGIKDRIAWQIAFSSQFVDDSLEDKEVVVSNDYAVLPILTSHKFLDFKIAEKGEQWQVWIPFHFLPGNEPESGTFIEKLICRKNSKVARKMLNNSLDKKNCELWPHLIGVTAHVFADTFSHNGFIGISDESNRVKTDTIKIRNVGTHHIKSALRQELDRFIGGIAQLVPMGHGAVATHPDIPFLSWEYKYKTALINDGVVQRENSAAYLEGARELHHFFSRFAEISPDDADADSKREWEDIAGQVKELINFQHQKDTDRMENWRSATRDGLFFEPTRVDLNQPTYGPDYNYMWQLERLKNIGATKEEALESDAYKFHRAARYHRSYVLHTLLPEFGIIVS